MPAFNHQGQQIKGAISPASSVRKGHLKENVLNLRKSKEQPPEAKTDGAESDDSYHDLKKAAKEGSLDFQKYKAIKNRRKNASKNAYTKEEVAKLERPNYDGI